MTKPTDTENLLVERMARAMSVEEQTNINPCGLKDNWDSTRLAQAALSCIPLQEIVEALEWYSNGLAGDKAHAVLDKLNNGGK